MGKRNKPTLMDIAKELGVTHSTVSRALAGNPRISEDTRRKVLQTAEKLDYSRKPIAQGPLRTRKTHLIELVYFTNVSHLYQDPLLLVILDNVIAEFETLGYSITPNIIKGDFLARKTQFKLEKGVVDGSVIVTAGPLDPFIRHHMDPSRCVFMDNQLPGCSSVNFDTDNDLSLMLEYIKSKNCKRVCALVTNSDSIYSIRQRIYSYQKLCTLDHFEMISLGVLTVERTGDSAPDRTFTQCLQLKPDAIICLERPSLSYLLQQAERKGIPIPAVPLIVSFIEDEEENNNMKNIPGIRLDFAELARQSAVCLVGKLKNPDSKPSSLLVQNRLTIPPYQGNDS